MLPHLFLQREKGKTLLVERYSFLMLKKNISGTIKFEENVHLFIRSDLSTGQKKLFSLDKDVFNLSYFLRNTFMCLSIVYIYFAVSDNISNSFILLFN